MVLKVDQDHKLPLVMNEDSATDGPVIIQSTGIMLEAPVDRHTDRLQPLSLGFFQLLHLCVLSVELSQYLNDLSLYLQLSFSSHQRSEGL